MCVCVGCRSLLSNLSCGCRAHLWNELKLTSMPCIALNNIQQNYGNLPGNLNMIEMPTANYDKNLHDRVAITAQDVFISTFRKPFGMQTLGSIFCVHIRIYAALHIIYSLNGDWTSLLPKCQNSFSICLSAILKFREICNELQTFRVYYHSCSSSYRDSEPPILTAKLWKILIQWMNALPFMFGMKVSALGDADDSFFFKISRKLDLYRKWRTLLTCFATNIFHTVKYFVRCVQIACIWCRRFSVSSCYTVPVGNEKCWGIIPCVFRGKTKANSMLKNQLKHFRMG